jgi:hypothetical protein
MAREGVRLVSWRDKVWEFLRDEPVYAPAKCNPYAEGWKFAFDQQTAKLKVAEKRLEMVRELAEAYKNESNYHQVGVDFLTILKMSEEELNT